MTKYFCDICGNQIKTNCNKDIYSIIIDFKDRPTNQSSNQAIYYSEVCSDCVNNVKKYIDSKTINHYENKTF